MPANKYALLRYRIIDRSIRNKAYPGKEDLRHACEEALYGSDGEHISTSTIDKDLWAMRNEGELGYYAPIKFSKEYGGYYYEDPDYTIAELPLNDDDLSAIQAAAETLYQFREIPLFKQFDAAIEKILDRMKISAVDTKSNEHEVIQFERLGDYKGSEHLQSLFKACAELRPVHLNYQKFGEAESKSYELHPYLLKEYRSRWYVIGSDVGDGKYKTFALDRIKSVEVLERHFQKAVDFDGGKFFQHAMGITVSDLEPEWVELEISEKFAPYILTQPIHSSQRIEQLDGGKLKVHFHVLITVEVISTILGFGDNAKVLAPSHLKDKVSKTLSQCLEMYRETKC